ncbi:lipoate--protein ligase family protein [Candidatus Fermentibacteria bacterium]|nr:lipoate--protein ligase family protein [Candidatus Fermentibacteria bacterium]
MGRCIVMECGAAEGAWNMAVDSWLMDSAAKGELDFALRVYTWSRACISFGRLQDPRREIDLDAARRAGLDLVRRPTGGRAVWHEHEVTYCVAAAGDHPLVSGGVEASIGRIGSALVRALASLGIAAELGRGSPGFRSRGPGGNPCFSSHGRSEVLVGGRKLVGSAQARRSGAFLEHGSIVLANDQPGLAGLIPRSSPLFRSADSLRTALETGVCQLSEISPGLDASRLSRELVSSFSAAAGCVLEPFELSPRDASEVSLAAESLRAEADSW